MKIRELLNVIDSISEDIPGSMQQASLTPVGSTTGPINPNGGLGVTNASQVMAQNATTSTSTTSATTSTQTPSAPSAPSTTSQPTSTQQTTNPTMGQQQSDQDKVKNALSQATSDANPAQKLADLTKNDPELANLLKNSGL